ncbi:MAG: (2Fe-2S)-binding protein [bacterium]|nr:(2Fe-2S)-binding protein [bacterium]
MQDNKEKIYICRCEEITLEEVQQAIKNGAVSLDGIKRRTHAGMGLCQGRTCSKLITSMLAGIKDPADILPQRSRPPVRTATISEYIGENEA